MCEKHDYISASDVNRFCYCPWQWYYERVHGRTHIARLARERNLALGYDDPSKGAFAKGRDFHENYLRRYRVKKTLGWLAFVLILVLLAALAWWGWLRYV